jgi:hypothetical protein
MARTAALWTMLGNKTLYSSNVLKSQSFNRSRQ